MKSAAKTELYREFDLRPRQPHPPAKPATPQTIPATAISRWRLLIVTDDRARLATWQASLPTSQWEITGLTLTEWAKHEAVRPYDLALVDVPAQQLADVLVVLRGADWQLPILVEASRLPHDRSSAGVLPHYRAFPGTQAMLLRVLHSRWLPLKDTPRSRRLL